jgi:Tfp pilus assembly protein PilX
MRKKKSVAIVIVWGILVMLALLAFASVRLMGNQGTLTENTVRRMRAYYTAKAAMVHALEICRTDPAGCQDETVTVNGLDAQVAVFNSNASDPCEDCKRLRILVDY